MLRKLIASSLLLVSASASLAEIQSFTAENISGINHMLYPRLDVSGLNGIDIRLESTPVPGTPEKQNSIKRIEFKLPYANNVIATNLVKSTSVPDSYRKIINSPWVFKKLLVEVKGYEFTDGRNIEYRVMVVENQSSNNVLEEAVGETLISGNATLVDKTRSKVVDVAHTTVGGKRVTLKLLDRIKDNYVQIEAVWMGHGSETLLIEAPGYDVTAKSITLQAAGDDNSIEVVVTDGFGYEQTSFSPSLKQLMEVAFGPMPQ
ncbi:MAG: hypothetical protein MK185_00945 [Saccharospirillaceae bacterium]|nr:hypothetical protein [Saccharospirillaceae bacterium]